MVYFDRSVSPRVCSRAVSPFDLLICKISSLPLSFSLATGRYFYSTYVFTSTFKPANWWPVALHVL